jgi:hypothetical protein
MIRSWLVRFVVACAAVSAYAQAGSSKVARLGDVATVLSDDDVREILRLSACVPASPWLLTGWRGQLTNIQFTEIYCAADKTDGALRRGEVSWVSRKQISDGVWEPWTFQRKFRYAQLVPPGRTFEQVNGERDLNQPFRVIGEFGDEELVSLVNYLRAHPSWVNGGARDQVQADWPVTVVNRDADGAVVATLSKDRWEGQRVILRRTASAWTILRLNHWFV